jgi:hypothetical protein
MSNKGDTKMKAMKKVGVGVLASAMAVATAMPMAAFAATDDDQAAANNGSSETQAVEAQASDATASTNVTWEASDSQLDITVPVSIHVVAKSDGSLITPTNATITNNSIFAVHGSKYDVTDGSFKAVSAITEDDASGDQIKIVAKATGNDMTLSTAGNIAAGDLSLAKKASTTLVFNADEDEVYFASSPDEINNTTAFTVTWHFEAGLNANS